MLAEISLNVPYREFGSTIKFEDASMKDVDADSLKCLVFVAGFTDPSHSEMRLRLPNHFNRIKEGEPSQISNNFVNECEMFVTLRSDNSRMEQKGVKATYRKISNKSDAHRGMWHSKASSVSETTTAFGHHQQKGSFKFHAISAREWTQSELRW
ncbi:unnamed protein product [Heligmosomoides polygyrus]|uniref:SHSP domain-containing protein n=1 Tax=Heligmosomoides polygyrus TaxID=6339 RepID=A0A183GUI8_HELPZ|nr:unnamed protein product [Heligmosomoides polygyrus]